MRISDWSSDVCSSDLGLVAVGLDDLQVVHAAGAARQQQALRATQQQRAAREGPLAFAVLVLLQHDPSAPLAVEQPLATPQGPGQTGVRSEERRVGKEGGSTYRYWWSPYQHTKKQHR